MNISRQPSSDPVFEDPGPAKLKKGQLPSLPPFKNPLIGIPIAQRLIFGFLIPALIAALAAGMIGIQSAQLLNQESGFYQNLFQNYASLTTGNDYLQLMNFKLNATLGDALVTNPSHTRLTADRQAVLGLETSYETLLQAYVQHDLLIYNPSQTALFDGAGHPGQGSQQSLLANSAMRTWQVYRVAQDQILQKIQDGQYKSAQDLEQQQGQLTYNDALSALRQLIQFDGRLTTYVQDATAVQQTHTLITTLIAIILVLLAIGIIGWLTYGTLVGRLRQLQKVAQAVQRGQIDTRVAIDGRDEITHVSASVNTMLDTIVGLLDETRVQRDALISAAERLFADMRLANDGEFNVKAAVNNDPIWMLSHAFNFTVGRFRRFVLRNQTIIEQLDVVSQQGMQNANTFLTNTRKLLGNPVSFSPSFSSIELKSTGRKGNSGALQEDAAVSHADFLYQVIDIRDQLQQFTRQNVEPLGANCQDLLEQAARLCQQVLAEKLSWNTVPDRDTIQRVRSLEVLIGHLSAAVKVFHENATKGLTEVYSDLNQLSVTARSVSVGNTTNATGGSTGLTVTQMQELARLTEGFGREVTGLAQGLQRIIEEMRTSLTPFRRETTRKSQYLNPVSESGRLKDDSEDNF